MVTTDSSAERLMNLVLALLNSGLPLRRADIRRTVAGYDSTASEEAFARMLERDKDTLRSVGIPIVTIGTDGPGDEIGYRIDTEQYELPEIHLGAAQMAMLGLAADLWRERSLSTSAHRAVTKLQVRNAPESGMSPTDDLLGALRPRLQPGARWSKNLIDAIISRRRVHFQYRAATSGIITDRRVEPWRVAVRGGGWYLIGFDIDREAPRVFHLGRVVGELAVRGGPQSYPPPDASVVDATTAGVAPTDGGTARLAVLPGRAGALRARQITETRRKADPVSTDGDRVAEPSTHPAIESLAEGRDILTLTYPYLAEFADEIAGYADAVLVLDPPELRDAVIERLHAAVGLAFAPTSGDRRG